MVGVGKFWKLGVEVEVGHVTSDSATLHCTLLSLSIVVCPCDIRLRR